ncbi:MAG: glutamine synthetase III [Oscillospiraceae bacterium]|nr:glutamine synthetase III [Oscillospiraceae bacterium]
MNCAAELFGTMVFNESVMKERLPEDIFAKVLLAMNEGKRLSHESAAVVADAMKNWAVEKGATHFTHWFQPMTGITAEKHDSFITPVSGGKAIMEFSGKELIQGEPDASSFPSGGLRATFEARGYTAWDPTSYAFIKDDVLYIPTAFCSYGGHALDKKTPLLRSMEALNRQCLRILKIFGNDSVSSVKATAGAEQEYFLIDKSVYSRRRDLIYTGRTLLGCNPPKAQELSDHYFGTIKPRVAAFMKELDSELWKLGVPAKTEHNEAAPGQHELAAVYSTVNIAADHNQLIMELMQKIAKKHGMVCLLHEKPFEGVNGSGKHNNWSLMTDAGANLLEPGDTPSDNAQFLLFLCAVIQAVDDYQEMLRLSVASASNDHRLGALEAPPAIVSIYIGDELNTILTAIENDELYSGREKEQMRVGVHVLPKFPKDTTDRNRTSPFAFTGNKFEFRMPGASASISGANVVLNTAVAESLRQYADALESADDLEAALHALIRDVIKKHKRIIFNGNGYDSEWVAEAARRGLSNLQTTPDAVHAYLDEKNVELFERHKVFTREEMAARYDMKLDLYNKVVHIEASTLLSMIRKDILPAVSFFSASLARSGADKAAFCSNANVSYEQQTVSRLSELLSAASAASVILEDDIAGAESITDKTELSVFTRDRLLADMSTLRSISDEMEQITAKDVWPYPSYGDILFSVN